MGLPLVVFQASALGAGVRGSTDDIFACFWVLLRGIGAIALPVMASEAWQSSDRGRLTAMPCASAPAGLPRRKLLAMTAKQVYMVLFSP
jgi:hypothetical protein